MSSLGNKHIMAQNIRSYMVQAGVSATDVCTALKIPMPTFSDWINAKTYPRIDKIEMLANYFGILKSDLVEEKNATPSSRSLPSNMSPIPKMKEWPVLGATACGKPLHRETPDETVIAPEEIKADVVFRCVGDSMINARIFDGDVVFVRLQPEVENGQIAVVELGEEYTLKRVYVHEDYVELRAENPTVKAIFLRGEELTPENFKIIGIAVAFLSTAL